jgi:hypothetical protein
VAFPEAPAESTETRIAAATATANQLAPAIKTSRTRALLQWYLLTVVVAAAAFAVTNLLVLGDITVGMWSGLVCVLGAILVGLLALTNRS